MKRGLILLLAVGMSIPAIWLRAEDAAPTDIQKLIDRLGDAEYSKREEAAKKIKAIGKPALPALRDAVKNPDPEIVSRAQALIKRIDIRPLPAPDRAGVNGLLQAQRIRVSATNGNRILEVTDNGREVQIQDGPGGITMSVTGLVDGKRGTEEYKAADAEQLKADNPAAYALYERYAGVPGVDMVIGGNVRIMGAGGGVIQLNGGFVQFAPPPPDEVEQLRDRLEKQMEDAKFKDAQRDEVNKALAKLAEAKHGVAGMQKYLEASDEFRKSIDPLKLDVGELLPPPAKSRLGISISPAEGNLVVQQVSDDSRAQRIGLKRGDEIRKIDGKEVRTVGDLRKAAAAKEKGLTVEVMRDGDAVTLEEK